MACDKITLIGSTDYNERFPPVGAKKGYVARIRGTAAGALKYDREFLGSEAALVEGDEGLYERQRGDKKGGFTRWYHVLLSHPEHGLILSLDCEEELPKIAKLLEAGVAIQDAVEVTDLRPSEKCEGRMIFTAKARNKAAAVNAAKSATIESAVEHCWQVLSLLPEKEAKKVLAALKERVSPKPASGEVALAIQEPIQAAPVEAAVA